MDLHISNLAPETTSTALKGYLKGKFRPHSISTFECKKARGKRYAFITIPHKEQAEILLRAFSRPGSLTLVNPLVVRQATQQPQAQLVEALRLRQRDVAESEQNKPHARQGKRDFGTTSVCCGVTAFYGNDLAFHEQWADRRAGQLLIGRKALALCTPTFHPQSPVQSTKIEIQYESIEKILTEGSTTPILTLCLYYAPKIVHLPKANSNHMPLVDLMARLLSADAERPRRVRGASPGHANVVATSLTYRIEINATDATVLIDFLSRSQQLSPMMETYRLKEVPLREPIHSFLAGVRFGLGKENNLDFASKFQLQRLAQNAYLRPDIVWGLVAPSVHLATKMPDYSVAQALRNMAREISFPGPDSKPADFSVLELYKLLKDSLTTGQPGMQYALASRYDHLFLVHQATVTPAGTYLEGPELCPANRILRKYKQFAGTHFLRVRFQDETGESIRYDRLNSLDEIHRDWFKRSVLDGCIAIAGKDFRFLGFSNSSLKEQSCWFMASFLFEGQLLTAWDVVKSLGDFRHIRSPAKCAARIGQAFSDTQGGAVDLSRTEIRTIPDVERNGRVFSDGCGTVSETLLKKIWKTYRRAVRPTCFQIRYAGVKGMVSLDSRLKGDVMCIRDSMQKFVSPDKHLEICEASRHALPFHLNRQLIKILEDLGVPEAVFLELQDDAVHNLRKNANSPSRAAAFLERYGVGKGCNLSWFIQRLEELDLSCFEDAFLTACIEHAVLMQLRLIKHKAKIFVPKAHTLFGIMDETGTIGEGQIVCRASGETVKGNAAVTRAPALHPGDVQLVTAVDIPAGSPLKRLDNCVIFSQKGARDLPSMLSGGDLDGDLYNVIFDKRLIPKKTYQPADYPRVGPAELPEGDQVETHHITNWFIEFMQNDQLPNIALAHVQMADQAASGTLDVRCLQLAQLHSTAVDFQKSGIAVNMREKPRPDHSGRPDFMAPDPRVLKSTTDGRQQFVDKQFESSDEEGDAEALIDPDRSRKQRQRFYPSQKVLGKLYRAIDERRFLDEFQASASDMQQQRSRASSLAGSKPASLMSRLFSHVKHQTLALQWQHLVPWAREVRQEYEEQMVDLMQWYSTNARQPLLELEVFSGEILGKTGSLPSPKTRDQASNMKEMFNHVATYIVRRIVHGGGGGGGSGAIPDDAGVELFDVDALWEDTTELRDEALMRSIACLSVSLEKGHLWGGVGARLQSFQYVAGMVALREVEIFLRKTGTHYMGLEVIRF